jgi:hypothetical protein
MMIFHSYIKLPEGTWDDDPNSHQLTIIIFRSETTGPLGPWTGHSASDTSMMFDVMVS